MNFDQWPIYEKSDWDRLSDEQRNYIVYLLKQYPKSVREKIYVNVIIERFDLAWPSIRDHHAIILNVEEYGKETLFFVPFNNFIKRMGIEIK
jgi:hypothetical protein